MVIFQVQGMEYGRYTPRKGMNRRTISILEMRYWEAYPAKRDESLYNINFKMGDDRK